MKRVLLKGGKVALVDDEDYPVVSRHKWYKGTDGYPITHFGLKMHQMIAPAPGGRIADHKNRNVLDNRKVNLRFVTATENAWNKGTYRGGRSKYKGVLWDSSLNRWKVRIRHKKKEVYLAVVTDDAKGARIYDAAARYLRKEFAYVNFKDKHESLSDEQIGRLERVKNG